MREGILDQLPKAWSKGNIVLVAGPQNSNGQKNLRSLIKELNRGDEWIRNEFRTQISEDQVPIKASVVLTMDSLTHGALTNIRRAAGSSGVCCPNQALTVGEIKEILRFLSQLRQEIVQPAVFSRERDQNGDGDHPAPGKGELQRLADLSASARQAGDSFSSALQSKRASEIEPVDFGDDIDHFEEKPDEAEPIEEISDQPSEASDVIEAAITAIDTFRDHCDQAQIAMLTVGNQLKAVTAERDDLQRQLGTKSVEATELRCQLESAKKAAEENANLLTKNMALEKEVGRLQAALDSVDNLIKGARQK